MDFAFQAIEPYLANFSREWLIIGGVLIVLFALTFIKGRGAGMSMLAAFYPATILYTTFPYNLDLLGGSRMILDIALYAVLWSFSWYVITTAIGADYSLSPAKKVVEAILVTVGGGIFAMGLLVANLQLITAEAVAPVPAYFFSSSGFFWWSFAPLTAMYILARR